MAKEVTSVAVRPYGSDTPGGVPDIVDMEDNELAINTADRRIWAKSAGGSLVPLVDSITRFVISQADATANPAQVGERIRIVATSETISLPFPQDPVEGQTITIITHQDSDAGFFAELSSTGIPFRVEDTESTAPHVLRFSVDDNGTETAVDGEYVLTFTGAFWTLDNPVSLTMPGAPDQAFDPLSERAQSGVAVEQSVEPLRASILRHSVTVTDGGDLQAAIDEVHDTAGKGDVLVVGELTMPGTIDLRTGVTVRGQHKDRSILKGDAGIPAPTHWVEMSGDVSNAGFADITLHGNDNVTLRFLYLAPGSTGLKIEDVNARNIRSVNSGVAFISAMADVGGMKIKNVDLQYVNTMLVADSRLYDASIDGFKVRDWASRVFWFRGNSSFAENVSWSSGYIYAPTTDDGFGGTVASNQPRQPFAIQGLSANDAFDDIKHRNLKVDDVTIYGPQLPWISGTNNGATADQFSFHHTRNSRLSRCVSHGGGDVGYTVSQYCSDFTLLECEAHNCDTLGAAIGVPSASTRRVTINGGVYNGNGIDAEGIHTGLAGGVSCNNGDDFRVVGGARMTDFNDPTVQEDGVRLLNARNYFVCPSTVFQGVTKDIEILEGCYEQKTGYQGRLLDTDTPALHLDGATGTRIQTILSNIDPANGVEAFQATMRVQLDAETSASVRGLFGSSSSRFWVKVLADGQHETRLRVDGGGTVLVSTSPAIAGLSTTPMWLRYEWDFENDEYRVLYSLQQGQDVPTAWITHDTQAMASALALSTTISSSVIAFGASANEDGEETAMTLFRAFISNGPTVASVVKGLDIDPIDAYYNPTASWVNDGNTYDPLGNVESRKYDESVRTDRLYVLGTVYADDTAAGAGGLSSGQIYSTATGELRVKL